MEASHYHFIELIHVVASLTSNRHQNQTRTMKTLLATQLLTLLAARNIPSSDAGTLRNLVTTCTEGGADYCHKFADCFELSEGAFECICKDGYSGDGKAICEDANECSLTGDEHPCPSEDTGGYCVNSFVHASSDDTASLEGYMRVRPKEGCYRRSRV
jgi:hypothetical protein